MTTVNFHLGSHCFHGEVMIPHFLFLQLRCSILFPLLETVKGFSLYVTKAFDWSVLPYESPNCGIKGRFYSSQVTSYHRFPFIAVITRNHGSIQSCPLGDSAGKLRPISGHTVAEWVLATAPSRARKQPRMNMKTLHCLTRNLHHRKVVFGPLTLWHQRFPSTFVRCQRWALRGIPAVLIFILRTRKKKWNDVEPYVFIGSDGCNRCSSWRDTKNSILQYSNVFSVNSPDVEQGLQALERQQRL